MSPALHAAHINLLNSQTRLPTAARLLVIAAVVVTKWDTRRKTRHTLARLDPHELHDIGLSRNAALAEAGKPFWRD